MGQEEEVNLTPFTPATDDLSPPTYEQSTFPSKLSPSLSGPVPLTLPTHLSTARTSLITTLLRTHISPHLHRQAASGLSKTTLMLIPSTTTSFSSTSSSSKTIPGPTIPVEAGIGSTTYTPPSQVVNLPDIDSEQDTIALIHLSGPENSLSFWRQEAVIRDLEQALKASLAAGGHRIFEPKTIDVRSGDTSGAGTSGQESEQARGGEISPSSPRHEKKGGFWGRWGKGAGSSTPPPPPTSPFDSPGTNTTISTPLPRGFVKVEVSLREVGLRQETDMGLYETRSGKVVVVGVEIGG